MVKLHSALHILQACDVILYLLFKCFSVPFKINMNSKYARLHSTENTLPNNSTTEMVGTAYQCYALLTESQPYSVTDC